MYVKVSKLILKLKSGLVIYLLHVEFSKDKSYKINQNQILSKNIRIRLSKAKQILKVSKTKQ